MSQIYLLVWHTHGKFNLQCMSIGLSVPIKILNVYDMYFHKLEKILWIYQKNTEYTQYLKYILTFVMQF